VYDAFTHVINLDWTSYMVENKCLIALLSLPDIVLFGYNFVTLLSQFHVTVTKR
jgi:hypothetical protein